MNYEDYKFLDLVPIGISKFKNKMVLTYLLPEKIGIRAFDHSLFILNGKKFRFYEGIGSIIKLIEK